MINNNLSLSKALPLTILLLILVLTAVGCSKNSPLEEFLGKLVIEETVASNLPLCEEYNFEGKKIIVTWQSTNTDVIENDGTVHLQEEVVNLKLIATATYEGETMKKVFDVSTIADNSLSILEKVKSSIYLPASLDSDISLPLTKTIGENVISISWSSDQPNIIDNTGKVTKGAKDTIVTLTATFSLNEKSVTKKFAIEVAKGYEYTNGELFAKAEVYKEAIKDAAYAENLSEYPGAVYYKVNSGSDIWQGIEVVVTLPEWIPDEGRTGTNPYAPEFTRYLDNPSIYLGNHCLYESDVGLSWMVGSIDQYNTKVDYSESRAFRPFWRYYSQDKKNTFENAAWTKPEYYYYPGDTIRMSVYNSSENHMQLRIELLEETTIEKYVKRRASYMLGENYSKVFTSPEFYSAGACKYKSSFKRVCALDQVSNEGKATQPTNAISKNVIWREVYLYREIDGVIRKVPMVERYCKSLGSPKGQNGLGDFSNAFQISYEGVDKTLGGQIVTISPNNRQ